MSLATRRVALAAACLALAGCATIRTYIPEIPAPRWTSDWFGGGSRKAGPLPELVASQAPQVVWRAQIGKAAAGFAPIAVGDALYVAAIDGSVARFDATTGQQAWRASAGRNLSAGVGADATIVVVGNDKGQVFAFDPDGKPLWNVSVSSEVIAPPRVAEGTAVIFSGDGRVYGLSTADGKTRWVFQRSNPPLTVRNAAGGTIARGGLFFGTPGGRLVAVDLANGQVAWEAVVATPKGATELERIADVTSLPVVDRDATCATAFQGRTVCFDLLRGTLLWSRDIASLGGIAIDTRAVYVTDDAGAVHALDKSTGASIWKQDRLAKRLIGGPQIIDDQVGVVDIEGWLHLISPINGAYVGRVATDGSAPTSQPIAVGATVAWQSAGGGVFAVRAR